MFFLIIFTIKIQQQIDFGILQMNTLGNRYLKWSKN